MTDKDSLRQDFLQKRRAHFQQKRTLDHAMGSRLKALLNELPGTVLAYRPFASEADPFGAVNPNWLYPRLDGQGLTACRVGSEQDFAASELGFSQPNPACAAVADETIDVVLVPGVAFDRTGVRIGFGKGYYDRFLKKISRRAERVGIAYSFQVSRQRLPKDEWDERVDWIVTDRYVLHIGKG